MLSGAESTKQKHKENHIKKTERLPIGMRPTGIAPTDNAVE